MIFKRTNLLTILVVSFIFLFLFLYVSAISPYWKISPDSTSYISGARSIIAGEGYKERGRPVSLYPPMTSIIFSICFSLPFNNYLVLNFVVTMCLFFSLFLIFILFKKEIGNLKSLLIVLLSLGSIYLFKESIRLLSDIFFMFFSVAAVVIAKRSSENEEKIGNYLLLSILVLAACMTRLTGIDLALSILIYGSVCVFKRNKKGHYWIFIFGTLISILFVVLWEYRNARIGYSYVGIFFSEQNGILEPNTMVSVIRDFLFNLNRNATLVTRLLTNEMASKKLLIYYPLHVMILSLLLLGLAISLIKKPSVLSIYVCIYLLHFFLLSTDRMRYLIAILPFLFYFVLIGIEHIIKKSGGFLKNFLIKLGYFILSIYIFVYLINGINVMRWKITKEHNSPFGAYLIKYERNYDLQKLALWLKDNLSEKETYTCMHPSMVDIITERKGCYFPITSDKSKILEHIDKKHIDYVLIDKKKPIVQKYLIPVIETYPDRFELIKDEKNASLYKIKYEAADNSIKELK